MRVLLSSDWRLGRAFHGADLLAEQTALVDQVVAAARERRVVAVLLAGGLLDEAATVEARELLEHAFSRLVLDEKLTVVALVGGEASFPGRSLLARVGLHVFGADADPARPIELVDAGESVLLHPLPACPEPEQLAAALERARGARRKGRRSLLLGSLPEDEDFELPAPKAWRDFAAAGLGGRRRPAELIPGRAWAAGSPSPWDFDDAESPRSLCLLEIDAKGKTRREELPLQPERAVRRLEGSAAELLSAPTSADRLRLVVTDEGLSPELGELAERFSGLLEIDRPAPAARACDQVGLFAAYRRSVDGEPLSEAARALLDEALG
jgi:exonuclease SbcD